MNPDVEIYAGALEISAGLSVVRRGMDRILRADDPVAISVERFARLLSAYRVLEEWANECALTSIEALEGGE